MKDNMKEMSKSHVTKEELKLKLKLIAKDIEDNRSEIEAHKESNVWLKRAFYGAIIASAIGLAFTIVINLITQA